MTLEELVTEVKKGDKVAEHALFQRLKNRYLMTCRRYVKIREDAEERMLDGFFKFFMNVHVYIYEHDDGLFAWIKRIMINECLMQLRNNRLFSVEAETEAENELAEEQVFARIGAKNIFKLVQELPLGYRTVFNLFVIDGVKHSEIANLLGITTGASKSQLNKAKVLLQKMILKNESYAKQTEIVDR